MREDGTTSFSVSHSFEVPYLIKIPQNRVTKNCSRFLNIYIEQVNTLKKKNAG